MANQADSEIKSLTSISTRTKSDGSMTAAGRPYLKNVPLHERCTMNDMLNIQSAFQEAYRNKLFPTEFRVLLRELLNVEYDDEDFNILFLKVCK